MNEKEIGERMRQLRREQKISAATLAKELGVTLSAYYRYERGEVKNPPDSKIASLLHTSLYDLHQWDRPVENPAEEKRQHDEASAMLDSMNDWNP